MFKRTVIESPIGEMAMYARKCPGDREVLQEVIMRDSYGIEKLDNTNFRPDVIVDIGANIGAFSALALKYWEGATLHAYEPHPLSFGLLNQNLRGHSNVTTHLAAVSGRALPNSFLQIAAEAATDAPQCWDLNQRAEKVRPDPETQGYCECDVRHIEDIRAGLPEGRTLVKIDCEGSEFYITEGMTEEFMKRIDVLVMEIHGSQLMVPDYLTVEWDAFRDKILGSFRCPELEEWQTLDREHRVIRAFRK